MQPKVEKEKKVLSSNSSPRVHACGSSGAGSQETAKLLRGAGSSGSVDAWQFVPYSGQCKGAKWLSSEETKRAARQKKCSEGKHTQRCPLKLVALRRQFHASGEEGMEGNGAGLSAVNHPPPWDATCLSQFKHLYTVPKFHEQVSRDLYMNRIKYATTTQTDRPESTCPRNPNARTLILTDSTISGGGNLCSSKSKSLN